jgi:hypothetical protein
MSIVSRVAPALRSAALAASFLPGALGLAAAPPDPPPAQETLPPGSAPDGAPQTLAASAAGDPAQGASNLRIQVEGNRRWCVRSVEQVWPSKPKPLGRRSTARRRVPAISTLAYAYYIVALPQQDPAKEPPAEPAEAATASPLDGMRAEGEMIQEEYLRGMAPEEAAAAAEEADPRDGAQEGGKEMEQDGGTQAGGGPAPQPEAPAAPAAPFGIDVHLASQPGALILAQSPVFHTTMRRRVNRPGQPLKVQSAWDNSRTCCSAPTFVEAALPPGRYVIQAHFDALFAGRGWKPVQVARIEGVEVKEGEVTQVRLRVDSQGYVAVNPSGRVVEFPDAAPAQPAGPGL